MPKSDLGGRPSASRGNSARSSVLAVCASLAGLTAPLAAHGQETSPGAKPGAKLGAAEYEGWRQYNTHCARCHGQDVLGNPVAANLLESAGAGGAMAEKNAFVAVVKTGRADRGMPAFGSLMSDTQIQATYAYVKGRADKKIPAGRPTRAGS